MSEGPEDSVVVVLEGLDEEEVDLEWDEPEPDELEGLDVDVPGGLDDGEGELCDVDKAGRGLEELDVVLVVESEELEELGVLCAPDDGAGELEVSELGDEFEQVPAPLVSLEDVAPKVGIVHAAVAITKAAPAPMNLPRFAITPLLPDVGTLPRRWGLTYPRQCPVDASRRCTCKETSTRWSSRGVAAGCWPAMTYQ